MLYKAVLLFEGRKRISILMVYFQNKAGWGRTLQGLKNNFPRDGSFPCRKFNQHTKENGFNILQTATLVGTHTLLPPTIGKTIRSF